MCREMDETASDGEPLAAGGAGRSELDVGSYLQQWLAHARGRVRTVTYEGYEALLRLHALPRIGHIALHELDPLDVQNLYGELLAGGDENRRCGAVTVLDLHLVLTQGLAPAVHRHLLAANPVARA